MKITVVNRRNFSEIQDEFTLTQQNPSLTDLKKEFFKCTGVDVNRQYFNVIENGKRGAGLRPGPLPKVPQLTVSFKKLGPQVSYRTVFIVEYLVPMLAFPLVYLARNWIYSQDALNANPTLSWQQQLAFFLHTLHFFKRELETLFVHKFSNATMPIFNIFKNSSYYWMYAFLCAYFILHPLYTAPKSDLQVIVSAVLFVVCLLCNGYCHIILSNLRKPGDNAKHIPRGFFFELVTCPNYFFEITEWLIFFVETQSIAVLLFALTGAGQMWIWACGKHRILKKTFDGKEGRELYPRNRKVLVPFLL